MIPSIRLNLSLSFVGYLILSVSAVAAPKATPACPEIAPGNYICADAKSGSVMPFEYIEAKGADGQPGVQLNMNGRVGDPYPCAGGTSVTKECTPEQRKANPTRDVECQRSVGKNVMTIKQTTRVRPNGLNHVISRTAGNLSGSSTLSLEKDKKQPEILNLVVGLKRGSMANQVNKFTCTKVVSKKK